MLHRSVCCCLWMVCCTVLIHAVWINTATAQPSAFTDAETADPLPPVPSPLEADANLWDVQFVGSKTGWAVGDQGVIWKSTDGGHRWTLQRSGVKCSLKGMCFLTNSIGWVVGEGTQPYTRQRFGVLLGTRDGGNTWNELTDVPLPPLRTVTFFGLKEGIIAGGSSDRFPTGVLRTTDGGQTWLPVEGPERTDWQTAAFPEPDSGVVAGAGGRSWMVAQGKLIKPRFQQTGLQTVRDMTLNGKQQGWQVGDGGLVLRTTKGGLVWEPPSRPLPQAVTQYTNFHAVAAVDHHVWIAGSPGRVIWHSPDGGTTWARQTTPQTIPIHRLYFQNTQQGWGVGALGSMIKTEDGGATWQSVRNNGHHLAMLTVHSSPEKISAQLFARYAHELGYRSRVLCPVRRDLQPDETVSAGISETVHDAVTLAGGSGATTLWQFPAHLPDLDHNQQQLLEQWNQLTEGRFAQTFLNQLVCEIRTWKPAVIVVDQPATNDATTRLLQAAIRQAILQAVSETRFPDQLHTGGLSPWQTRHLFQKLQPNQLGDVSIRSFDFLPRLQNSVIGAASPASSLLNRTSTSPGLQEQYQLLATFPAAAKPSVIRDLFQGLLITPGSAARRALADFDDRELQRHQKRIQQQRNFHGYVQRYLKDPRHAGQLIAELRTMNRQLLPAEAARQLAELADEYRRHSQTTLWEATLVELVERYPDEPMTVNAMRELFHLWSGMEFAWQRAKNVEVGKQQVQINPDVLRQRIQQVTHVLSVRPNERTEEMFQLGPDPVSVLQNSGEIQIGTRQQFQQANVVKHWQEQAIRMASLIRQRSPAQYASGEIQFPLMALMRQRGNFRLADQYTQPFLNSADNDPWKLTAAAEMWLNSPRQVAPKSTVTSSRTNIRPQLDGIFSDACWEKAETLQLKNPSENANSTRPPTLVMFAYDQQFLYLAASVPRVTGVRLDGPQSAGRTHDADLTGFDRLSLHLDLDRDYVSHYTFEIDQRGWTAERCGHDRTWNPKWYVATEATESHWRIEAAIPFAELAPAAPQRNHVWAVGIRRSIPGVGVQSWTQPITSRVRPETFGLLKFD